MVSLEKCDNYSYINVKNAVVNAIDMLGGIEAFVKKGDRVVIKPNLIMGKKPDECATTHPSIVRAVCEVVIACGAEAIIAESPGGPYTKTLLTRIYDACGMTEIARQTGASLNFDTSVAEVDNPDGEICKKFTVIKPITEADCVIDVCKLKTHGMTLYTGAVKNLFGVIPGTDKVEYHFRMPEKTDFCNMLVDICECVKPKLCIMDAVFGMEGAGPTSGTPVKTGLIMASDNAYEMDVLGLSLIGYEAGEIFTAKNAARRGICEKNADEIDTKGENYRYYIKDYKKPATRELSFVDKMPNFFKPMVDKAITPKPVFIKSKCIGCGECARTCPAKVIAITDKKASVDLSRCIRCFCCQELCPVHAVRIERTWIMKLLSKI